jgi:hypothetical protein
MSADTPTDTTDSTDSETIPLNAAGDVRLPIVDLLTGRGFITGKSGSGKSNTASVVAEELLDDGHPMLLVDTDGEYYGLKEAYELLHAGADESCDIQVGSEHAAKLAELALEQSVPIILDVSGYLDSDEADALVRETARHLFVKAKELKRPFPLIVEEVHEYIPEGGALADVGEMLIKIGKRGRKHGLGIVGISQRPADVKKDFITQANWLVWHRLTWENDTTVVRRVVDGDVADAVADLVDGEAYLQTDWNEADVRRVQVRRKETFDAGATPGLESVERPDLKSVGGDLVDELEQISEQEDRRQDRIAQLEDRVEKLQQEKEDLEDELENARDMRNMASQFAEAMQASGGNPDAASEKVDELIDERNELRSKLNDREETIAELESEVEDLQQYKETAERLAGLNLDEAEEAITRLADALGLNVDGDAEKWRRKYEQAHERVQELEGSETQSLNTNELENPKVQRYLQEMRDRIERLDEYERGMLRYYMIECPDGIEEAYKYAGGSPTSSARNKKNRALRDAGFVAKKGRGEYDYALREHAEDQLGDHFEADTIDAAVTEIEATIDEAVMQEAE